MKKLSYDPNVQTTLVYKAAHGDEQLSTDDCVPVFARFAGETWLAAKESAKQNGSQPQPLVLKVTVVRRPATPAVPERAQQATLNFAKVVCTPAVLRKIHCDVSGVRLLCCPGSLRKPRFIGNMRALMEAFGIHDHARRADAKYRDEIKNVRLPQVLQRMKPVSEYMLSVVDARSEAVGRKNVEGPEGSFYHASVRRFADTITGLEQLLDTLTEAAPRAPEQLGMGSLSTQVGELWFATARSQGQARVPGIDAYSRSVGAITKEYLKRSCPVGFNYVTNMSEFYQAPRRATVPFSQLQLSLRGQKDVRAAAAAPASQSSAEDLDVLKLCAFILKPTATAAPMDKYRKPAGLGPSVLVPRTAVEEQLRRADKQADRSMVDVVRAEPAAGDGKDPVRMVDVPAAPRAAARQAPPVEPLPAVVRPLSVPERAARRRKKKVLVDAIDPDWIDWMIPARSTSALLDQMAAAKAAVVEREFQNDSEDDEREYQRIS
ncbi:MAG: hypothetical protein ACJ8LM_17775 [Candidatus Udaeobacter sp.]